MSLTIFDIAKGISWTEEGHFYLTQKEDKYELIVDYLNSIALKHFEEETQKLITFQNIQKTCLFTSMKLRKSTVINNFPV